MTGDFPRLQRRHIQTSLLIFEVPFKKSRALFCKPQEEELVTDRAGDDKGTNISRARKYAARINLLNVKAGLKSGSLYFI